MRFSSKIIAILSMFPFMFTQCNDIENDKRLLVKGMIADANSTPQKNLQVYTSVGGSDILGEGETGELGEFNFTSLSSNSYGMSLVVELPDEFKFQVAANESVIDRFSIPLRSLQDGTINLSNLRIYPFAEVKINFVRETEGSLSYEIKRNFNRSLSDEFFYFWNDIDFTEEVTPFRNITSEGILEQGVSFFSIHEIVQKNEIIELTYQVNNEEEQSLFLNINQDYNEFEISF